MTKKTLTSIKDNFLKELIRASKGKKTSLSFLETPLPQKPLLLKKGILQIIVVGGSVLKSILVDYCQEKFTFLSQKKESLPLLKTKETLFSLIKNHLYPSVNLLCLNFAFPLKPKIINNSLDGRLVNVSKKHQLKGLLNELIGQELEKYIFQKQKRRVKTIVANDTICLLLAGLSQVSWTDIVAGIVGTGTNFAFFLNKNTTVNLESGNFNHFPQSKAGKIIDRSSTNPGKQLFEKEVAGAYLFHHYQVSQSKKANNLPRSTLDLNHLAYQGDRLAQKLFERSSALIASQIAGIYLFKKYYLKTNSTDSAQLQPPLTFVMEGSVFWQGWRYKKNVLKYLRLLGVEKEMIEFIKIENSDIRGALELIKKSVKMI